MKKVKTRKIDNVKYSDENDNVDYNDNVCEDIGKVREMRKLKLKIIVKMRKRDSFKDNNDVDYNDDEYEDIGKVRKMKIGQEDGENED